MSKGENCLACDLTAGRQALPGGVIHQTSHWAVEHCIGPLGVGTLIVKPLHHTARFTDRKPEEAAEFDSMLLAVANALGDELAPDQTYICQWSHAGWTPRHVHFVVQPEWEANRERFERPVPFTQMAVFEADAPLNPGEVDEFCDRMRARLTSRSFRGSSGQP